MTIPLRSPLLRAILLGMATVFAAGTILYSSLWMYAVRHAAAPVELGFSSDYFDKDHSLVIQSVTRGSPAEQAGLRVGDHLLAVNGRGLPSQPPIEEVWFHGRPGDPVELQVQRPGQPGTLLLHATFRAAQSESSEAGLVRASALQLVRSFPVIFLVVGLPVLFLRVDDKNAWLLALLFAGFIALPGPPTLLPAGAGSSFAALTAGWQMFARAYRAVFLGLFGALFYLFFALFPTRSLLERRLPWLKWAGFVLGASAALPSLAAGDVRAPALLAGLMGEHAASRLVLASSIYLFFALGIVSLIGNARCIDPEARRKTRVILWGTITGVLPASAERLAVDFAGFRPPFWLDTTVVLVVFLFPLSFAYAVVKHRVLEIPVLLKRSARYLLVKQGFVLVTMLVTTAAFWIFVSAFRRSFRIPGELALPVGMGVGIVVGAIFTRINWYIRRRVIQRIDRAFFRSAYDVRVILQDLAEKTRAVTDRHELARLLQHHIEGALHPKSLACYLESGDGKLVAEDGTDAREPVAVPAALPRPKFPFRFGARFIPRELDAIPATLPLLRELTRRGRAWEVPPPDSGQAGELAPLAPECLVPILGRNTGLIGLLVLGQRLSEEPYSSEDKDLLDSVAGQAGVTLENIALAEKMAEQIEAERRVAVEMDIARRVQARLFPQNLPRLETIEYVGGCVQARQVGGDYYDFLDLGPGGLGVVLADISGKGMSGALLMANLQANLRSQYATAREDLPRLLQSVNGLFCENTTEESYATMFFGVYDDACRKLRYANCGHIAPLLLRADGSLQRLNSTTTVLGLFLKWECPTAEENLCPGDLLVICTDGVTEAPNPEGEEYGEGRLVRIIREHRSLPVNELLAVIQASIQEFSGGTQADDITLIVARCG